MGQPAFKIPQDGSALDFKEVEMVCPSCGSIESVYNIVDTTESPQKIPCPKCLIASQGRKIVFLK